MQLWKENGLLERELQLYRELSKHGVEITFLTYGDREDLRLQDECNPVNILPAYSRMKKLKWKWLSLLQSLLIPFYFKDVFRAAGIYKTNQMFGSWAGVIASRMYKKPLLIRTGYTWSLFKLRDKKITGYWLASILEKISYGNADIAVVASPHDADYIRSRYKISAPRIKVVPQYIDTDIFSPSDTEKYIDRLVFVGRLTKQKNLGNLVRALEGSSLKLDIYGSGELRGELEALAKDLNVEVSFMGNIPNSEVFRVLNRYHVFILPSLYEGSPKSLLEAMSCAMVVVGTKVEGIREVITDNVNGLLCGTSPESIKAVVKDVFSRLGELSGLRRNARETVLTNCRLGTIVSHELETYRELLENRSSKPSS